MRKRITQAQTHQHDHLYDTQRWKRRAALQMQIDKRLCRLCLAKGVWTVAEVVDHIEPHGGDLRKFYEGELQALCRPCHARKTATEQGTKLRTAIGVDGWPIPE